MPQKSAGCQGVVLNRTGYGKSPNSLYIKRYQNHWDSHWPSIDASLPAMDPYGKVIGAMLRPATLVLVVLASAAAIAHAFWAPFPGSGENPGLDLVAYHDPGFHAVIRTWYYAAPAVPVVLAGSLGLSVWRVWLQPRVGSGGRRGSSHQRSCAAARLRLVSVAQSAVGSDLSHVITCSYHVY